MTGWIRLTHQTEPPHMEPVLIRASDGTKMVACYDRRGGWWQAHGWSGPEWDCDWEDRSKPYRGVTHYMPLPPDPKV